MFKLPLILFLNAVFSTDGTDSPIIGVLSQETYSIRKYLKDEESAKSFIAASYVKYLESAGARVVPIWIGQELDYYERLINYTNGAIFPGGATYFTEPKGYGETASIIYKLAVEANKNGKYYPLWGTCLGMEVFAFAILNEDIRTNCDLHKVAVPVHFVNGYENSKLLSQTPQEIIQILRTKNVTYNYHRYCLTEAVIKKHGLDKEWKILSTNKDEHGEEFVSMMESTKQPFYGVQFHPEKSPFEFKNNYGIPHCRDSIRVAQYFANFFVDECRKSKNNFPDSNLEKISLIYNYQTTYTGLNGSSYEQIYFFTQEDFNKNQLK
ncbi:unnamed protein product [Brassicogethes aeneus]|uniref:folate gamma-glutamyl hydrolase n=1 Tax=Brassicogethes aeneus TaxID=1431903 RepID=A0A9P0FAE9_BRAAE|nr:unnamed protein product [Brassicogethes aeneus]